MPLPASPTRAHADAVWAILHTADRADEFTAFTEEGQIMATYISLLKFTDQGIRNVKDSPDRYGTFKAMAEKMGITVKGVYYTTGRYDVVTIMEGTDEAVTTALLKAGSLGNVRSETLRGFTIEEAKRIIGNIP
jgi:uncharacterized protein with GYD domain